MADDDPQGERGLRVAATAASVAEAELIRLRLAEAGITAIFQRNIGGPEWGGSGFQSIFVEAAYLDRAREVLSAGEGFSDDELAELSDQASKGATEPDSGDLS